eukprot:TRINITY_DN984_c0_g1_i1.p1 TRINITY_DN984_c0_g1~~TRINITY_DN984_c0_g1_i1.p1  ORF type:complete len:550 (-),score=301.89 TRINITY_DN984_c0_g1_i1:306-1955(-)
MTEDSVWTLKKGFTVEDERQWEEVQTKTFQGWVNMHLEKIQERVTNLEVDLCDGVKLIKLLEVLHGSPVEGRYYKNPKSRPYKIDNVNFALSFIRDAFKVKLIGCSAEDIVDGNLKIILGMLWRLIQKFHFSTDSVSRQSLLAWCRKITEKFQDKIPIDNFHKSFQNGLAFCAIAHAISPGSIDVAALDPKDAVKNLSLAFSLGQDEYNIAKLLDPADVSSGRADERSIITYISLWHKAFDDKTQKKTAPKVVVSSGVASAAGAAGAASSSSSSSSSLPVVSSVSPRVQTELTALKAQLEERNAKITSITINLEAATRRATDAEAKVELLEKTVNVLRASAEAAAAAAAASGNAEPRSAPVETAPAVSSVELEALKSDLEAKTAKLHAVDEEITAKDEEIASLNGKVDTLTKSLESVQKELEETQEALASQQSQRRHKRSQEKSSSKKKGDKILKKKERELEKLQTSTASELRSKNEEIKLLKSQLLKAQQTIRETAPSGSSDESEAAIKSFEFIKAEYEDLLHIVQVLEEDEKIMNKKNLRKGDSEKD